MSKYGIFIGAGIAQPELLRFEDSQTDTHSNWVENIRGLTGATFGAQVMRRVDLKDGLIVDIWADPEGLWESAVLNRYTTMVLEAAEIRQFLVGNVVILPTAKMDNGMFEIIGWDRADAMKALEKIRQSVFYHLKYNYKRRHEYGGAPTHPQLDGRGA